MKYNNPNQYIVILFYKERDIWEKGLSKIPKATSVILFYLDENNTKEINECFDPLLSRQIKVQCRKYKKDEFQHVQSAVIAALKEETELKQKNGLDTKSYMHIVICTQKWNGLLGSVKVAIDGSYSTLSVEKSLTKPGIFNKNGMQKDSELSKNFTQTKEPSAEERARAMERIRRQRFEQQQAAKEEPVMEEEEPSFDDDPVFDDEPSFNDDFLGPDDDFLGPDDTDDIPDEVVIDEEPKEEEKPRFQKEPRAERKPKPEAERTPSWEGRKRPQNEETEQETSRWGKRESASNKRSEYDSPNLTEPPKLKEQKPKQTSTNQGQRIIMPNINRPHKKDDSPKEVNKSEERQLYDAIHASMGMIREKCAKYNIPFFGIAGMQNGGLRYQTTEEFPEADLFKIIMSEDGEEVDGDEDTIGQLLLIAHGYSATPSRISEVRDAKAYLMNALQLRIQKHVNDLSKNTVKNDTILHFINLIDTVDEKEVFEEKWSVFCNRRGKKATIFAEEEDFENIKKEAHYYLLLLKLLYSGDRWSG